MASEKGEKAIELIKSRNMVDVDIAKEVGLSRERVRQLRTRLKYTPVQIPRKPYVRTTSRKIPVELRKLLGKVSDLKLADQFNINKNTVFNWRRKLGIPAITRIREITIPPDSKWKIIGEPYTKGRHRYILAECVCGSTKEVVVSNLRTGMSKGCKKCSKKRCKNDNQRIV